VHHERKREWMTVAADQFTWSQMMPVCPRCRIAYLDTESHTCQRDASSRVGPLGRTAVRAALGAVVATVVAGALTANGHSGALVAGVPAGVIVGVLIVVLARR